MKQELRKYLKNSFFKLGTDFDFNTCSDGEILYWTIYFKEGLPLPMNMAMRIMDYAKAIVDANGIKTRVEELKTGDINFGDFLDNKEMAEYLENGDKI